MTLIDELAPLIVAEVNARKEAVIAQQPGFLAQTKMRIAWPIAMALIPGVLSAGYAKILAHFGALTIDQLIERLAADYEALHPLFKAPTTWRRPR